MNEELIKALAKQGIEIRWGFDGKPQYYRGNKMLTGKAYGDAALLHSRLSTELSKKQTREGIDKALDNPYSNTFLPITNVYSAGKKIKEGNSVGAILELSNFIPGSKFIKGAGKAFINSLKTGGAVDDFIDFTGTEKKRQDMKNKNKFGFGGYVAPVNEYLNIKRQRASNIPNQIESPDTALVDNEIRLARAAQKAENNPWTQGLDLFGNLAMQVGSSMMSQGASKVQGVSKGGFNWGSLLQQGVGAMGTFANSSYATGGVTGKVPINAEGGEVIETPGGEPQELQGDSHAEGGIDLQVPEGTEIYSKRLKGPDGKSMADRKKARERQLAKLEKLAKSNPTDKTIRKTLGKTKKDFQIQEQQDMQKMQMMHQMTQMQQAMEHFATGGTAGKPLPVFDWMKWGKMFGNGFMPGDPDGNMSLFGGGDDYTGKTTDIEEVVLQAPKRGITPIQNKSAGLILPDTSFSVSPEQDARIRNSTVPTLGGTTSTGETTGDNGSFLNKLFGQGGLSMGDMIGLGGQLYSTFAPMKNTQANRAGDTPNINAFKDYGKDALHKMDQSKQYVNQVRDENLKDLELARTGQISRNRNSARGLNTQRALDLTADANINDTKSKIFSQFAQAMQQIYGQEATLENDQDAHVMQGEYMRDLADRQDRDNYFSQMAQDIATKGTGLQHIGKNVNEIKSRGAKQKELDKQLKQMKQSGEISIEMIENLKAAGMDELATMLLLGVQSKGKEK